MTQLDLPYPATHKSDPETSHEAAAAIRPRQTKLHRDVLDAFRDYGDMTDERLETLERFRRYGPSTIRKRRSELYQMGLLEIAGFEANSRSRRMVVWGMK